MPLFQELCILKTICIKIKRMQNMSQKCVQNGVGVCVFLPINMFLVFGSFPSCNMSKLWSNASHLMGCLSNTGFYFIMIRKRPTKLRQIYAKTIKPNTDAVDLNIDSCPKNFNVDMTWFNICIDCCKKYPCRDKWIVTRLVKMYNFYVGINEVRKQAFQGWPFPIKPAIMSSQHHKTRPGMQVLWRFSSVTLRIPRSRFTLLMREPISKI